MTFAIVNGIRTRYSDAGGDGEPLVFISGTGNSGHIWEAYQVPFFADRYRCITYDLRGTGETDAPEDPYSVAQFGDDCAGLLEHLGVPAANFVGMSLGSAIIQELAITRPQLVRRAGLLATWSSTPRETHIRRWFEARLGLLREGPMSAFRRFAFVMWAPSMIDFHPEQIAELERIFAEAAAPQPLHAYINHFEADLRHDTMDQLHQIRCPALVLYGDEDLITLPWYNRAVAERIPNCQTVEIKGGGHYAFLEHPDEVNKAVAAFLDTPV